MATIRSKINVLMLFSVFRPFLDADQRHGLVPNRFSSFIALRNSMRFGVSRLLGAGVLSAVLAGCAGPGGHPQDPFEPFNRAMFSFNETVDDVVLRPVAQGYRSVLPEIVRTGVSNFFSNLEDLWIGVNNFLQGKPADGVQDVARFAFNSTFGILGLIDVSSELNIPKHNEDFGQTMGRWGIYTGPYLVLPMFGPSNIRDGVGFAVDFKADMVRNLDHVPTRNTLYALRAVNTRANLLDIGRVAEEAALDKYRFMRDAHFQRRNNLVHDGNPPRDMEKSELPGSESGSAEANATTVAGETADRAQAGAALPDRAFVSGDSVQTLN